MPRPAGRQHDASLNLALPAVAKKALTAIAKAEGVSLSALLRGGVRRAIADAVPELVAVARDETRSPGVRLGAAKTLRLLARADLHLSPVGLQLAQAKIAQARAKVVKVVKVVPAKVSRAADRAPRAEPRRLTR